MTVTRRTLLAGAAATAATAAIATPAQAAAHPGPKLDLDVRWHAGWPSSKHDPAPEIQSHAAAEDTVIMRQNKSVNFEAPFMFLLFGADTALLVDTGATAEHAYFPLRRTVDAHVRAWLARHPNRRYRLLVAHTHGHGDHKAADAQFTGRERTTVVGPALADVIAHYGFTDWPNAPREIDLGGRIVDVVPSPGHHSSAVAFHDRRTGLLLTGDTLYPGHLYVQDWAAYAASVDRLVARSERHPVSHVLGCHVEMSLSPGLLYPRGSTYQPHETALPMTVDHLRRLQTALRELDGKPGTHVYDDFAVVYGAG